MSQMCSLSDAHIRYSFRLPRVLRSVPEALAQLIREVAARAPSLDVKCVQSAHSIDVVEAATSKRAVVETIGADCSGAILCIGDQGQEGGNDFELLACHPATLSVDRCSSDPTRCWNLGPPGERGPSILRRYLRSLAVCSWTARIQVELLMRDDLAERVLAHVMSWDPAQIAQFGACLQDLARYKYDEYEGFGPGEKFVESLAAWLWQLEPGERADAIQFVMTSLVFVSRLELDHVIGTVYPDVIRPILIRRAAEELGLPPYKVAKIAASREFRELERKTLVLGLADGSRLDRLRRASPKLSHEQVYLAPEIGDDTRRSMRRKAYRSITKA